MKKWMMVRMRKYYGCWSCRSCSTTEDEPRIEEADKQSMLSNMYVWTFMVTRPVLET